MKKYYKLIHLSLFFTAHTTVPANLQVVNPNAEIIYLTPDSLGGKVYPVTISASEEPFYCILKTIKSNVDFIVYAYLFQDELINSAIFRDINNNKITSINVRDEIRVVNKDIGQFEVPFGFSFSARFNNLILKEVEKNR